MKILQGYESAHGAENLIPHPRPLSRTDNETLFCPDCGTREALESIGVKADEQEQIINTIHRHTQNV